MSSDAAGTEADVGSQRAAEIDWELVWEESDLDPSERVSATDLHRALMSLGHAGADRDEVRGLVEDAAVAGELTREQTSTGKQYHVAGAEPPSTQDDPASAASDEKTASERDTTAAEDGRDAEGQTGEHDAAQAAVDGEELAELRDLVEQQAETIQQLDARVGTLETAIATFAVGPDSGITRDEFTPALERRHAQLGRLAESVEQVRRAVDGLGEIDAGETWTKEDRVHAIRTHLVEQNRDAAFAMDYTDVKSFFDGRDAGISQGYASKLLEAAAEGHQAFRTRDSPSGRTQITVDRDQLSPGSPYRETATDRVSRGNNAPHEEGG